MSEDVKMFPLESNDTLDRIFQSVLVPAFSAEELEPLKSLRGYLESDPVDAFGLYAADSSGPIGCCIYYPYREANSLLLGYMAVVSNERSTGVGTQLFEASRDKWFGSNQYELVLAELDDPRVYPVINGINPQRRIEFYSKLGAELICGPYFQPCVRPGGQRVYDMLLVKLGGIAGSLRGSRPEVPAHTVAAFLREYFSEEEDSRDSDGGDLQWLMEAYEGKGIIPVLPVADYRNYDAPTAPSRSSR